MLPDIGGSELIVIAIVALIVVGPKDLPLLLRKVGQFVRKMRGLASDFRASFDEMARQSELDELRKEVQALRDARLADPIPASTFDDIRRDLEAPALSRADPELAADEAAAPSILPPPEPAPPPEAAPKAKAPAKAKAPKAAKTADAAKPAPKPKAAPAKKAAAKPAASKPRPAAKTATAKAKPRTAKGRTA